MKSFCLIFASYHLKSYKVSADTIQILLEMSLDFVQNEQKARLALNCIAEYLMKIPQGSVQVFPVIYKLLHTLSLKNGIKLCYSLLRSIFYCLLYKDLKIERREIIGLFLGIRKIVCMKNDSSQEEYFQKARGFAYQSLHALYKENSRLLFPYVGRT